MEIRSTVKKSKQGNKNVTLPEKFKPRFWEDSDSRLAVVRNIRSRYHILREAVGGHESPQRDLLAQRIAFLTILIETAEVRAAEGDSLDIGVYTQSVNALTGLLKTVGLEKRGIKSAHDLKTYLIQKDSGREHTSRD